MYHHFILIIGIILYTTVAGASHSPEEGAAEAPQANRPVADQVTLPVGREIEVRAAMGRPGLDWCAMGPGNRILASGAAKKKILGASRVQLSYPRLNVVNRTESRSGLPRFVSPGVTSHIDYSINNGQLFLNHLATGQSTAIQLPNVNLTAAHEFSPDGSQLAVIEKNHVRVYDVAANGALQQRQAVNLQGGHGFFAARFAPNGSLYFLAHQGMQELNLKSGVLRNASPGFSRDGFSDVIFSPDGRYGSFVFYNGDIKVMDLRTEEWVSDIPSAIPPPPPEEEMIKKVSSPTGVSYTSDGNFMFRNEGGQVWVYDMRAARLGVQPVPGKRLNLPDRGRISCLQVSSDGQHLFMGTDERLTLLELENLDQAFPGSVVGGNPNANQLQSAMAQLGGANNDNNPEMAARERMGVLYAGGANGVQTIQNYLSNLTSNYEAAFEAFLEGLPNATYREQLSAEEPSLDAIINDVASNSYRVRQLAQMQLQNLLALEQQYNQDTFERLLRNRLQQGLPNLESRLRIQNVLGSTPAVLARQNLHIARALEILELRGDANALAILNQLRGAGIHPQVSSQAQVVHRRLAAQLGN